MNPNTKKRQVDFQVIARWVDEGDRVLDLGCGRGVLLESLMQTKSIRALGVDIELEKILSCVKRGVPAYHGDVSTLLSKFGDDSFERVILSRSVDLLEQPDVILNEALRVGKRVTVGFVNHGYWKNRWHFLLRGARIINEVYPKPWYATQPSNTFSVSEFEEFCASQSISIAHRVCLSADWHRECKYLPNLMAGYAIYDLAK